MGAGEELEKVKGTLQKAGAGIQSVIQSPGQKWADAKVEEELTVQAAIRAPSIILAVGRNEIAQLRFVEIGDCPEGHPIGRPASHVVAVAGLRGFGRGRG